MEDIHDQRPNPMPHTRGEPTMASNDGANTAAVAVPITKTNPVQRQSARVALQLDDRAVLLPSHNDATQSGDEVMRQIRGEYDHAMIGIRHRCLFRSPFRKPALYLGTMSTLSAPLSSLPHPQNMQRIGFANPSITQVWLSRNVEAGEVLREVAFSKLEYSADLTAAFLRPDILRGTKSFAERYPDTIAGTASTKAVVISSRIGKAAVCRLLALSLILATAAGVGIGIGTSSIQNGFACFAGVGTLLPLLISFLQWMGT